MKKCRIFALAAIMVLGLAFAAQATTINSAPSGEVNLWDIVSAWTGTAISQADLEGASTLQTLPIGAYTLLDYARYAGYNQTLDIDGTNLLTLTTNPVNVTGVNQAFSVTSGPSPFTDTSNSGAFILATDGSGASDRLSGLIIDLGLINSSLAGQYLVAFEDGDGSNFTSGVWLGDQDYNDMVARVVPVPPSALLMGSGLLGLGLLGWRRRFHG